MDTPSGSGLEDLADVDLWVDWFPDRGWVAADNGGRELPLPSFLDVKTDDDTLCAFARAQWDSPNATIALTRPALVQPRPCTKAVRPSIAEA